MAMEWNPEGTVLTFSIAADTKFARLDPASLDDALRGLAVTKALDGVSGGSTNDVGTITYRAEVPPAERILVQQVVNDHTGIPAVSAEPDVVNGKLRVEVRPRDGTSYEDYSVNWTDPTTWHTDSVRHTAHVPADQGGGVYRITGVTYGVVDVTHGKITQERRLADMRLRVYVDGVEVPEEEFGWADYEADPHVLPDGSTRPNPFAAGDWTCDYATGTITFKSPPAGVVTCDWSDAVSSAWYITPDVGHQLHLLAVEINASMDVVMRDSVCFVPQILAAAAAAIGELDQEAAAIGITPAAMAGLGLTGLPGTMILASREADAAPFYAAAAASQGVTVEQFKAGVGLPLQDDAYLDVSADIHEYKVVRDFIVESQRAYPLMAKVGGANSRGMTVDWFTWRWPYEEAAARLLVGANGTRVKIHLRHDIPYGGEYANASVYAIDENGAGQ